VIDLVGKETFRKSVTDKDRISAAGSKKIGP
jgi:hypothetical protein